MSKFAKHIIILLFSILCVLIYLNSQIDSEKNNNTEICVVNNTEDTVTVFLTLGSDTDYVTDVYNVFGIKSTGLKGYFNLNPNDTVSYKSPKNKGFNGNIAFGAYANNCPDTTKFPYGINIFEFAINNDFNEIENPQETIDISCVSGVNSRIKCYLSENNWNAGDTFGFWTFENSYIYDNVYRIGVFPFGCDSCTVIKNPPTCLNKKFSHPQLKSICNVQRDASKKGGKIYVTFNGFLDGIINKTKK